MRLFMMIPLLLAGCAETHVVHVPFCPLVMSYSSQSQNELAQELQSVQANSQIMRYLLDYKRERDVLKACKQH